MVKFQTTTLISIGLKNTTALWWLIFRDQNLFQKYRLFTSEVVVGIKHFAKHLVNIKLYFNKILLQNCQFCQNKVENEKLECVLPIAS